MALLAMTGWVLTVALCQEVPEAIGAATQPTVHGNQVAGGAGDVDLHGSCHGVAHASAVAQFSKALQSGGIIAGSAPSGATVPQSVLAVPTDTVVEIARAIDDCPRARGARFASFWPHAPPVTL